jgi:hypothetical protein
MQLSLGHDVSRYSRARVHWSLQDFHKLYKEGAFYTELARYFIQNPRKARLVTKEMVVEIALQ